MGGNKNPVCEKALPLSFMENCIARNDFRLESHFRLKQYSASWKNTSSKFFRISVDANQHLEKKLTSYIIVAAFPERPLDHEPPRGKLRLIFIV
jgi:hypothetical protein